MRPPQLVLALLLAATLAQAAAPAGGSFAHLVEGHTVFAVLAADASGTPAAPVGVALPPATAPASATRSPGVLWFNDQYLVTPVDGPAGAPARHAAAVAVQLAEGARLPCGGAILAARAGDPDPRNHLDAADLARWSYQESYRIGDPNSRSWVVDHYLLAVSPTRTMPVWATNVGGGDVFAPDRADCASVGPTLDDRAGLRPSGCSSFECRMLSPGALCNVALLPPGGPVIGLSDPSFRDEPCHGWMEPSRNGYCYTGVRAEDANGDLVVDHDDCVALRPAAPLRQIHAVLLVRPAAWDAPHVDHVAPYEIESTNACEPGTVWACPRDFPGAEGNSHSFHPHAPLHDDVGPCPVAGPNPTHHGGSTAAGAGRCDYRHATLALQLVHVAATRPPVPAVRLHAIEDFETSSAPFADHHAAYPFDP